MVIHGQIYIGFPKTLLEWRYFTHFATYNIGSFPYSLDCVYRLLRGSNAGETSMGNYHFSSEDPRLRYMIPSTDPRIHFLLCNHIRSSPQFRFVSPHNLEDLLQVAAEDYCGKNVIIDVENRKVTLSMLFDWFEEDFHIRSNEGALLSYLQAWLSDEQKIWINQLLDSGLEYSINFQFDWAPSLPLL